MRRKRKARQATQKALKINCFVFTPHHCRTELNSLFYIDVYSENRVLTSSTVGFNGFLQTYCLSRQVNS